MDDISEIPIAFVDRINSTSALLALARGGLFHKSAPENQQPPFIVYDTIGASAEFNTGDSQPTDMMLQLTAYTATDTDAYAASRLIRKAFHNKPLPVDGVEFVELTDRHIDQDPDDLSWSAIVTFTIHGTEND